jgi:Stress responsive A/B Barrel Domain
MKKLTTISAVTFAALVLIASIANQRSGRLLPVVHASNAAAGTVSRPSTVIHVITIQWKAGVTDDQKASVRKATEEMAQSLNGVKSLWMKPLKVQGTGFTDAIVMEFESKAAFDAYAESPAHRQWEKVYLPLREESRTHDVTN